MSLRPKTDGEVKILIFAQFSFVCDVIDPKNTLKMAKNPIDSEKLNLSYPTDLDNHSYLFSET